MKSTLKIAHVIFSLRGGGAETQLTILANYLANQGNQVTIYCLDNAGRERLHKSIEVLFFPRLSRFDAKPAIKIFRCLKEKKPDLLHIWLPASISIPALIASKLLKTPSLFSFRNKMFFYRYLAIIEFVVVALCADRIASNNPIAQSSIFYRFLYRIKNGVEIENAIVLQGKIRLRSLNPRPKKISFTFAGRITKQKNWRMMLAAFELLADRKDWLLNIYGTGEDNNDLEECIKKHACRSQIIWHGFVENRLECFAKHDVFILPSLWEGMPNVLIEAMAAGLLCLVSDIQAHHAILSEEFKQLMFDPSSPHGLKTLLDEVLDGKLETKFYRQRALEVAAKYTPEKMGASYLQLYKEIINAPSM